ncbi:hypothetical protein [Vibrio europaeus]|uniref:hypothetical protein n=1 Tax=Vibrio europaeus TaxID=300876 RepID=UPI00233EACCB|nr:hypothetical protein [Vibrio europaeus]MDC5853478.1 hypothetical protein [Vibrio europaeus]
MMPQYTFTQILSAIHEKQNEKGITPLTTQAQLKAYMEGVEGLAFRSVDPASSATYDLATKNQCLRFAGDNEEFRKRLDWNHKDMAMWKGGMAHTGSDALGNFGYDPKTGHLK